MSSNTAETRRIESGLVEEFRAENERLRARVEALEAERDRLRAENKRLRSALERFDPGLNSLDSAEWGVHPALLPDHLKGPSDG